VKPERWKEIEALYHAALEQEAEERSRFLIRETEDDDELRREVDSLLEYDQMAERFLETTALDEAAKTVAGGLPASATHHELLSHLFESELGETQADPELRITTPDGHPRTIRLKEARYSIGRSEDNEIAFPEDDGLSRHHILVSRQGDGWMVNDLESKNGTFVNGKRLGDKHRLQTGDRITASCLTIIYSGP
jgi:hypothetical protein